MKVSSFIIFPAMIGFAMVADTFVEVLLTDKWLSAVIYIRILCLVFMLNIIQKGNLEAIKASGRSDLILKMEVLKKSLYLIVIVIFLIFTDTPQLLAIACFINALIASLINTFPNRKIIGYSYKKQVTDLLNNIISAILMGIVVYFVGLLKINNIILLCLQIISGIISYIIFNLILKNETLRYCFLTIKHLFRRKNDEIN